jgi:hypothetical protein
MFSLEIHNCEHNFKQITLHMIRALTFRDAVYGNRELHREWCNYFILYQVNRHNLPETFFF